MPIEHVLQPHPTPLLSGPLMIFIMVLLGVSIFLTVIQSIQNKKLVSRALEQLLPRMNDLLAQKNIEASLRKNLQAKENNLERAKLYADALRQSSKPDDMADEDWSLIKRVQERMFMQDRTNKKSFLLLLGVVLILAGLIVPLQKEENPIAALENVAAPVGLLVIYLIALIFVRFQQKAPLK